VSARQDKFVIEYKPRERVTRSSFRTRRALFGHPAGGADNPRHIADFSHSLYSLETPADAAQLCIDAGRLFAIDVNDNFRGWDDDMVVGSVHLVETFEFFYTLRKLGYDNDLYALDVFPKEMDTVENFSAAVSLTAKLEEITNRINPEKMEGLLKERNSSKTIPYLYSLL
jgi:xylose isomerase